MTGCFAAAWYIETLGWAGFVVLLLSFFLTMKEGFGLPRVYYWLNLLGSLCIGTNSYVNGAMPSAILNLIWTFAAALGLVIVERRRRRQPPTP